MKPFIAVILVLALSAAVAADSEAAGEASVLVRTIPLRQEPVTSSLTCYGVISADPRSAVSITLSRSTRVSRLLVTQGQVVGAGARLAEVATSSADSLNYERASLSTDYARRELARVENMTAQRLATQSQLAAARKALADAEAALREQERIGTGRRGETLTAPFAGTVTAISVKEGDFAAAGTPLMQLSRRGAFRAALGVEPEDIALVKRGMNVLLAPVFGGRTVAGKILEIHGVINPQTRLVDVIVSLEGRGSASFLPGMQVRGVIGLSRHKGWVVPRQAVLRDSAGEYLFQVDGGRARRVGVASNNAGNGLVEVRGALNPGLKVVYLGNYELRDGMAVREAKGK